MPVISCRYTCIVFNYLQSGINFKFLDLQGKTNRYLCVKYTWHLKTQNSYRFRACTANPSFFRAKHFWMASISGSDSRCIATCLHGKVLLLLLKGVHLQVGNPVGWKIQFPQPPRGSMKTSWRIQHGLIEMQGRQYGYLLPAHLPITVNKATQIFKKCIVCLKKWLKQHYQVTTRTDLQTLLSWKRNSIWIGLNSAFRERGGVVSLLTPYTYSFDFPLHKTFIFYLFFFKILLYFFIINIIKEHETMDSMH